LPGPDLVVILHGWRSRPNYIANSEYPNWRPLGKSLFWNCVARTFGVWVGSILLDARLIAGVSMPTRILEKERLIPCTTSKLVLDALHIAHKARPGHFVILRMSDTTVQA
jgi:hypothetical protein